jgi:hypothetical protein
MEWFNRFSDSIKDVKFIGGCAIDIYLLKRDPCMGLSSEHSLREDEPTDPLF